MANSIAVELGMGEYERRGRRSNGCNCWRPPFNRAAESVACHVVRSSFDAIGATGNQPVTIVGWLDARIIQIWMAPRIARQPLEVGTMPPRLSSRRCLKEYREPLLACGITAGINPKGIESKFQCGKLLFAHNGRRKTVSARRELIAYLCAQNDNRDQRCNHRKDHDRPARLRGNPTPVVFQNTWLSIARQYTTAFDHAFLHAPAREIVAAIDWLSMQFCALCRWHLSEVASIPD